MLINIQMLRFLAALLVVLYHAAGQVPDAGAAPNGLFRAAEAVGFAGVDIFFVISGFIMFHTTQQLEGTAAASAFIRRRAARIYSGYWPFFVFAVLLWWWADPGHLERAELLESAMLWPARYLLIPVAWTLVFEMYFYLLFTGLVWAPERARTMVLAGAFAAMLGWVLVAFFVRNAYAPDQLGLMTLTEYWLLSPYMLEFLAGALLARYLRRRPNGPGLSLLLLGAAGFAVSGWVNVQLFDGHIEQGYTVAQRVLAFGISAVLIVAGLVRMEHRGWKAPLRFSLVAGGASYAIYLSHTLLLTATRKAGLNETLRSIADGWANLALLLLAVVIVLVSIAWYRGPERWLHRAFRGALGVGRP